MYIPFDELPPQARVWVYQANRLLTEAEQAEMKPLLQAFATDWSSHGNDLQASAELLHDRFLVLANNESATASSGCSIDKSVNFVRDMEQRFNVSFLDRTQLAFLKNEDVELVSINQLKDRVAAGDINKDTLYFDTLVNNFGDLQADWPRPAQQSWLARYF